MAKVPVTVEVPKELNELGDGLAEFVAVIWPKLKDGLQASDVGAIIAAVIALTPALKGVEHVPGEMVAEPEAAVISGAITIGKIVKVLRAA